MAYGSFLRSELAFAFRLFHQFHFRALGEVYNAANLKTALVTSGCPPGRVSVK